MPFFHLCIKFLSKQKKLRAYIYNSLYMTQAATFNLKKPLIKHIHRIALIFFRIRFISREFM